MEIDKFVGNFRGGARPNKFRVQLVYPGLITPPDVDDEIMVRAAAIPAANLGFVPVPWKGRQIPYAGDRTYDPWTVTVTNDTTFSHWNAFHQWSNAHNSHEGNLQTGSDHSDLVGTAIVTQLGRDNAELKTIRLLGILPTLVGEIQLSYEDNDTIETYDVTFQFVNMESQGVTT